MALNAIPVLLDQINGLPVKTVNGTVIFIRDALKDMRQTIRGRHLQLKSEKTMADLSAMFAPMLKGWQQYYDPSADRRSNRCGGT